MAYGAQLYNVDGDIALDLEQVLTTGESGTARSLITIESEASADAAANSSNTYTNVWSSAPSSGQQWVSTTNPSHNWDEPYVATDGSGTYTENSGFAYPAPPMTHDKLDMVFVDISTTGLVASYVNYYNIGGTEHSVQWLFTEDGSAPDYVRCRSTIESGLTGDYGMQLFDSSSNVIFDSRADLFTIFDSFFVAQADVQDVLENDATYTYTLSKSAAGAKVCLPFFGPFIQDQRTFSDITYACRIKQTASDTITLDRVQETGGRSYSADSSFYHSFSFFVGR